RIQRMPGEKPTEWDSAMYGAQGATSQSAIKKGANVLWRISNPEAKATLLVLPGDALKATDDNAKDLRARFRESIRYVYIDPEQLTGSGDMSGKTLAFVFANQINFVNQLR